jgi:hypothetical protein
MQPSIPAAGETALAIDLTRRAVMAGLAGSTLARPARTEAEHLLGSNGQTKSQR